MKKIILGLILIITILVLTARSWVPTVFTTIAKGNFNQDTITIKHIQVTQTRNNRKGKTISAKENHKFVNIDMKINLPLSEFDFYDLQLVKENNYEIGYEKNLGDHLSENYFEVYPLNDDGTLANDWDENANVINMRISFEVPTIETQGYLFYWGEYIGPLNF